MIQQNNFYNWSMKVIFNDFFDYQMGYNNFDCASCDIAIFAIFINYFNKIMRERVKSDFVYSSMEIL